MYDQSETRKSFKSCTEFRGRWAGKILEFKCWIWSAWTGMGSDHQIFRKSGPSQEDSIRSNRTSKWICSHPNCRIQNRHLIGNSGSWICRKTKTAVLSGSRRKACVLYQCGTGYTPFSVWTGNIGCNHRFGNRLCEYRFSKCGRKHEDSVSVGSVSESGRWGNSTGWIQHRCGVYERTNRWSIKCTNCIRTEKACEKPGHFRTRYGSGGSSSRKWKQQWRTLCRSCHAEWIDRCKTW